MHAHGTVFVEVPATGAHRAALPHRAALLERAVHRYVGQLYLLVLVETILEISVPILDIGVLGIRRLIGGTRNGKSRAERLNRTRRRFSSLSCPSGRIQSGEQRWPARILVIRAEDTGVCSVVARAQNHLPDRRLARLGGGSRRLVRGVALAGIGLALKGIRAVLGQVLAGELHAERELLVGIGIVACHRLSDAQLTVFEFVLKDRLGIGAYVKAQRAVAVVHHLHGVDERALAVVVHCGIGIFARGHNLAHAEAIGLTGVRLGKLQRLDALMAKDDLAVGRVGGSADRFGLLAVALARQPLQLKGEFIVLEVAAFERLPCLEVDSS